MKFLNQSPLKKLTITHLWNEEQLGGKPFIKRYLIWKDLMFCDVIKSEDIPKGRKLIGCKWIIKEKRDGVFGARLVALGYTQIAGTDFTDNYLPVVNDSTFRLVILIISKVGLKG
jgi:hypothetical protein